MNRYDLLRAVQWPFAFVTDHLGISMRYWSACLQWRPHEKVEGSSDCLLGDAMFPIGQMPAGSALDDLIARVVLGWQSGPMDTRDGAWYYTETDGTATGFYTPYDQDSREENIFQPSRDVLQARHFVLSRISERLIGSEFELKVEEGTEDYHEKFIIAPNLDYGPEGFWFSGNDEALIICRMALSVTVCIKAGGFKERRKKRKEFWDAFEKKIDSKKAARKEKAAEKKEAKEPV